MEDDPAFAEPEPYRFPWSKCGQTNKNLEWYKNKRFEKTNEPLLMKRFEVLMYDCLNPDESMQIHMDSIKVKVTDAIFALSRLWKLNEEKDVAELKRRIRYQLVMELWKLEDRKNVKRVARDKYFKGLDSDSDEGQADDGGSVQTNMSPKSKKGFDM